MITKGNMIVKVKKHHGTKLQGIEKEIKWGIQDEEANLVLCHIEEDNMGTNLKVEDHEKPMPIKSMVKN